MCNNRENQRTYYVNQYGLENANKIRRFEYLKTKRARYLTSINFLKRCRDNNLIPTCVQIAPKKDIKYCKKILNQASKKLLCQLIKEHRYDLNRFDEQIKALSNDIETCFSKTDFHQCVEFTNKRAQNKYNQYKIRQIRKYHNLELKSERKNVYGNAVTSTQTTQTSVVNLSKQTLDDSTIEVLNKGFNFAPAPRKIPIEEIITNVEDCLYKNQILKEDSEVIRQDISSLLRRSKPPKSNLSRDESRALSKLRKNEDITVLKADKGNATVILDTDEYIQKMSILLSDQKTYKIVDKDPTTKILKNTSDLIKKHAKTLHLDIKSLVPSCVKPPKLYGLPKIHKKDVPFRPIVSQIDTPTYKLAQHVAKVLSPLRGHTTSYVRDSYHFVSGLKDLKLANNETMVSFDVQSLFTSIPMKDCIKIVKRKLEDNNIPYL